MLVQRIRRGWGGLTLEESDRCIEVDVVGVDEMIRSGPHINFEGRC